MSFVFPIGLAALLLVPLGIFAARFTARRRIRALAAFANAGGPAAASANTGRYRRFVPGALLIMGFAVLAIGLARPQVTLGDPRLEGTVILVFDVSGSMAATDVKPTRIDAAKAAAIAFVKQQPSTVQIGVVAFSDSGLSVQAATDNQAAITDAINRLTPQRATSLGAGILAAVQAVDAAENPNQGYYSNRAPSPSLAPVPAASDTSALIVVLSDGENNQRPDIATAAQVAADRGIRVDTVGVGTSDGTTIQVNGFTIQTAVDASVLQQVADITDGRYVEAPDADHLAAVYQDVDQRLIVTNPRPTEVTAVFSAIGLLVLLTAASLSLVT